MHSTIRVEAKLKGGFTNLKYYSSPQSPFSSSQTPNDGNNIGNEKDAATTSSSLSGISPLILLVITVLAVIFFAYGLVHLVLWFLMKRPHSSSSLYYNSNRFSEATRTRALQRQLQHLFRLQDSGIDQGVIDALPVFNYKDLLGLKEPFDCAVCLCEFSEEDKMRLVPMCSHAFHMNCLDTWLLSNSTCPLCRATLSSSNIPTLNNVDNNSLVLPHHRVRVTGEEENECSEDSQRAVVTADEEQQIGGGCGKRVFFSVRLGKFRNNGLEGGGEVVEDEGGGSRSLDERRCYSMGSYQYVVPDLNLQVALLSQSCGDDDDDDREGEENGNVEGKRIIGNTAKRESFSVSKIWLWSNKFPSSNAAFP